MADRQRLVRTGDLVVVDVTRPYASDRALR
jgi:hypothetical protein